MKTELWIVFAQDSMGHVTLAGSYEVGTDPLPGLRQVLASFDPEALDITRFFAVRVLGGAEVSLHYINALPTIDEAEVGSDEHNNCHREGFREGQASRSAHICEGRS